MYCVQYILYIFKYCVQSLLQYDDTCQFSMFLMFSNSYSKQDTWTLTQWRPVNWLTNLLRSSPYQIRYSSSFCTCTGVSLLWKISLLAKSNPSSAYVPFESITSGKMGVLEVLVTTVQNELAVFPAHLLLKFLPSRLNLPDAWVRRIPTNSQSRSNTNFPYVLSLVP